MPGGQSVRQAMPSNDGMPLAAAPGELGDLHMQEAQPHTRILASRLIIEPDHGATGEVLAEVRCS